MKRGIFMRKISYVLLAFAMALILPGCAEKKIDLSRIPEIMLVKIHVNYAEGQQQTVTVIDREGKCRSSSVSKVGYGEHPEGWVDLSEDDWYARLLDISENGSAGGNLSDVRSVWQSAERFSDWSALPEKVYDTYSFDYGSDILYGVYYENGAPKITELACAGDVPSCKDGAEVRDFVNGTGLLTFYNFT